MTWELALYAIVFVFGLATIVSLLTGPSTQASNGAGPLSGYLLAGGTLGKVPVQNLLLSTSFGINSIFYQGYLGLTVGLWGIVIQAFWATSFFWLSRHTSAIRDYRGLHDFLSARFGASTRLCAAAMSLIGMTVFLGWEADIGKSTIEGLVVATGAVPAASAAPAANWYIFALAAGTLLYTLIGGLRGNSWANVAQNALKLLVFCTLLGLLVNLYLSVPANGASSLRNVFFPSFSELQERLGLWALLGNIVFSLVWQFVDMTTWQSLTASSKATVFDQRHNLRASGILVFFTPGVLGTLLGVFLAQSATPGDNVVVKAISALGGAGPVFGFLLLAACAACVMSLIDGLFLGSAYTFVVDVLKPNTRLDELDKNIKRAKVLLLQTRIAVVLVAIFALWLVPKLFGALGYKSSFEAVYLVTVSQLALFGPVWVGLTTPRATAFHTGHAQPMWAAILFAFAIGLVCSVVGAAYQVKFLSDGSSTFTVLASLIAAKSIVRVSRAKT